MLCSMLVAHAIHKNAGGTACIAVVHTLLFFGCILLAQGAELEALCDHITKYGEYAQVTYDKMETTNIYSSRFGGCRGNSIDFGTADRKGLQIGTSGRRYKVMTAHTQHCRSTWLLLC